MAEKHGALSINSDNIFPIIKKWLYSDHDIFYRELISNGCDAITKLKKLDMMGEYELPEGLKEMFYGPFYQLAKVVWDWCIGLSTGVISQDPQHFSPATWKFVTDTLYPWAMGIGLSMMNVFFICVFLKAASNLKENITLELCIEGMIPVHYEHKSNFYPTVHG